MTRTLEYTVLLLKPSGEIIDWKWLRPEEGLNLDLTISASQALEDFLNHLRVALCLVLNFIQPV